MKGLLVLISLFLFAATLTPTPDAMAYCTPDDLKTAYGATELAEVTGDAQQKRVDTDRLQDAIDQYGDYMEQHVRAQHPDNPFDDSHAFLNGLNVEGAYLTLQKWAPGGTSEDVRKDLKRLDRILMRVASGKLDLMDQEQKDNAPSQRLNPEELMQQGRTRNGEQFGLHRDLPDFLVA